MSSTILVLPERRHFALPAMIVLGALAALFLGFPQPRLVYKPPPFHPTEVTMDEFPVSVVDDPPVDPRNEPARPGGPSPLQLPNIPDPIPTNPNTITIPVPPGPINTSPNAVTINPWPGNSNGPGMGPDTTVYDPGALDQMPKAIVQVAPVYPFDAKSQNLTGGVTVEFVVDESGRVHNPRVIRASDAVFAEPTLRAVEQWRFTPGKRHGVPVRFRMSVPVNFNLD